MPVHIRTQVLTLFRIYLFNNAEEMREEAIPAHSHNSAEYLSCYRKVTFTKIKAATCRIQGNSIRLCTFSVSFLTISILRTRFLF